MEKSLKFLGITYQGRNKKYWPNMGKSRVLKKFDVNIQTLL